MSEHKYNPDYCVPPSWLIQDYIDAGQINLSDLADLMGVDVQLLEDMQKNYKEFKWQDPGPEDRPEGLYWWKHLFEERYRFFVMYWSCEKWFWNSSLINPSDLNHYPIDGPLAPCEPPEWLKDKDHE